MSFKSDLSIEILKILKRLTAIMDQIKEELKHNDNSEESARTKRALRSLVSSQGQLLKAFFSLDPSYKIPPLAGETWEHFLAKNCLMRELRPENIFAERGVGGCVFDVLAKIGEEYVIVEAETKPSKCVEKAIKIKKTVADLLSGKLEILEEHSESIFQEIIKRLEDGKPIRLIFVVTRKPNMSTLKEIKKVEDPLVYPEVYHVNTSPPFEITSNLLEKI